MIISNLTTTFALNKEPTDQCALARMLTSFSLPLQEQMPLCPELLPKYGDKINNVAHHNLDGPHSNFALIHHCFISLACVTNNTFHLWLTTTFNGGMIIPDKALQHLPPGMRDILHLVKQNAVTIYVHKPLYPLTPTLFIQD